MLAFAVRFCILWTQEWDFCGYYMEDAMKHISILMVLAFSMVLAGTGYADVRCQLGILTPETLEGNNPATSEPWQVGDQYRLVFISSTFVDPQTNAANDIAYWNDAVQAIANSATSHDLSSVSWKIIGSTSSVDARDNTSTNPNVDGTGHAIFGMDGSSVIENNYEDLWDGAAPQNKAWFDENGVALADSTAVNWPLTGTGWNGTRHSTAFLKDTSTSGNIRQGHPTAEDGRAWIDAGRVGASWFSVQPSSVYGMSEPLSIQAPGATVIILK